MTPDDFARAVRSCWAVRDAQTAGQPAGGRADADARGGVTDLLADVFAEAGFGSSEILRHAGVELPGYYRPTRMWDLVVVSGGRLVAAIEVMSQFGPPSGGNVDNRTDEAIGKAVDVWRAYSNGTFGAVRPWLSMLRHHGPGTGEPGPPAESRAVLRELRRRHRRSSRVHPRALAGPFDEGGRRTMTSTRPYVLLSVASSLDGYIDDCDPERLLLSNDQDFDRVDEVRAGVDGILVGAATIRADNPRLLIRSADRRKTRVRRGMPESPIKVTMTGGTQLDPEAKFFSTGDGEKLVYTSTSNRDRLAARLGRVASVVGAGDPLSPHALLADLAHRNVTRLMIEGGGAMHTLFLGAGLVDELHIVFAPFFVGDHTAPRFVNPAEFPQNKDRPMTLAEVQRIGNVVLLRYLPTWGGSGLGLSHGRRAAPGRSSESKSSLISAR